MLRFIFSMSIVFFSACGGSSLQVSSLPSDVNLDEQISKLERDIQTARVDGVHDLSPTWFSKADRSLREAQENAKVEKRRDSAKRTVARGQAELQKANEVARLAQGTLKDLIEARKEALSVGADTYTSDFMKVEERFKKLMLALEEQDISWAQKRKDPVIQGYRVLELRAIKKNMLTDAKSMLSKARKIGAEEVAPKTLQVAEKAIFNADQFISQNRYQKEKMQEMSSQCLFEANRLIHLTNESILNAQRTPEEMTLRTESFLHKISRELQAPDMRNQDMETQVSNILGFVGQLKQERDDLRKRVEEFQKETGDLRKTVARLEGLTKAEQAANAKLQAEKDLQRRYDEVRRFFRLDEAEVYKQDKNLLIRMRAMKFPIGQAFIAPENYELLSKVQRAILLFGSPNIVIEGHTDTTGSDVMNHRLSQMRAESVKKYFLANKVLPEHQMTAVGFGSTRPISSNETEQGRATNRRIDIMIQPSDPLIE